MELIHGYIYSSLMSLLWVIACVGTGSLVTRGFTGIKRLEWLLINFLTGCIAWTGIGIVLCLFGIFRPWILHAMVYIVGLGSLARYGKSWWNELRNAKRLDWLGYTLAIVLFAQAVYALMPVTAFDAVYYHLPLARHLLDTGTLSWTPLIFNSSFPQSHEILQATGLAIGGDASASFVSWWFSLATTLALVAIGQRLGNKRTGMWASLFLALTPLWFWLAHVPYNECAMAFGIAIIALTILMKAPGWVIGLAIGWVAGIKYYGVEIGIIGFIAWFWQTRPDLRQVMIAVFFAVVVSVFWYARNLYLFANPIFPYYHGFFQFLGEPKAPHALDCVWAVETQFSRFARPVTLEGWLLFPIEMIRNPAPHFIEDSILGWHHVGWLVLLWPIAIITILRSKRELIGIFAFTLTAAVSWPALHGIIYLRHLSPLLPMMYLLSFVLITDCFTGKRFPKWMPPVFAGLVFFFAMAHLIGPTTVRGINQLPFAEWERQKFMEVNIDGWPMIRELNRLDPPPVVYFLYGENEFHYCEFPVYANWRGPYGFDKFTENATSGKELSRWLEEIGVDVLLINEQRLDLFGYEFFDVMEERAFLQVYKPVLLSYQGTSLLVHRSKHYDLRIESSFDD